MLLQMKVYLRPVPDSVKKIRGFIVSQDSPESLKHFIMNQSIRLKLTDTGFSILESTYTQEVGSIFYQGIAWAMCTIDFFDKLAVVFKYSSTQHSFGLTLFWISPVLGIRPCCLLWAIDYVRVGLFPVK
jgi:hypothetical protein